MRVGVATTSAMVSARCRAMALGISSPTTTSRKVMAVKAMMAEIVRPATPTQAAGSKPSSGSSRPESAGSPSQPRVRLATVTPSCVAAMKRSKCCKAFLTARAPGRPSWSSSSTRVGRTLTSAYSAATKKALINTKTSTPIRRSRSVPKLASIQLAQFSKLFFDTTAAP